MLHTINYFNTKMSNLKIHGQEDNRNTKNNSIVMHLENF